MLPVAGNVYMLVGDGGNIVVQTGDEGPFVVDSGAGQLSDKMIAAIRKLSDQPIQFIANTSLHAEHTGGNVKLARGRARSQPSQVPSSRLQFSRRRAGRDDHRRTRTCAEHAWSA